MLSQEPGMLFCGAASVAREGWQLLERALQVLRSRAALARYSAVLVLERVGQPDDGRALQRLRRDRVRLRGLERAASIGVQAGRVRDRLMQKHPPAGARSDRTQELASRVRTE